MEPCSSEVSARYGLPAAALQAGHSIGNGHGELGFMAKILTLAALVVGPRPGKMTMAI